MPSLAHRLKPLKYAFKSFVLSRRPEVYWAARRWVLGPLEAEIDLIGAFADPAKIALDVGANFGAWSLPLSKSFRHVHAFEPQPRLAAILDKGLGGRVTVHQAAVSDRAGQTVLRVPKRQIGRSTIDRRNALADLADEPTEEVQVAMVRLDDFGFEHVGFIKIDVEGHEQEVLAGARAVVGGSRPIVLVETEERHVAGAPEGTRAFFAGQGYTCVALGRNLLFLPHAN